MKKTVASLLHLLSILSIAWMLTACGPKMKTITDYYPPTTDNGLRCVTRANQDRASCDQNNKTIFAECTEKAVYDADRAYLQAKNDYTIALENYIVADDHYDYNYAHYEKQKRLLVQEGELKYIRCSDDVKMQHIEEFPKCEKLLKKAKKKADKLRPPTVPVKPYAPNRDRIYKQMKSKCHNLLNNCEQNFNQSYIACGGSISNRQVCVSNCS